ncbi:MAG TPA: TIGR03435 family protein, partial [Bryobacteraceae bacterium]|nr:TIGR03435 family protein [Bryobacteraceae bacterium]
MTASIRYKRFPHAIAMLIAGAAAMFAQTPAPRPAFEAFDVASIKPAPVDSRARYIRMQGGHQFQVRNYTVRRLIGAAYNLTSRAISGGPAWAESDSYEILAITPGDVQPRTDEQMAMLRKLLADR